MNESWRDFFSPTEVCKHIRWILQKETDLDFILPLVSSESRSLLLLCALHLRLIHIDSQGTDC